MSAIDLRRLPAPEVIDELDYEIVLAEWKADLSSKDPAFADVLNVESEPLTKLVQVGAYREYILRQRANDKVRDLLLAFAQGATLDHIGVTRFGVERLLLEQNTPPEYETDEAYLRRLLIAPDRFSTAGSEDSYVFHALSADGMIKDVKALNMGGGRVLVPVLSRAGSGLASAELVAVVEGAINAERVRPLTDSVEVCSATINTYHVVATLYIRSGPDSEVVRSAAEQSVQQYAAARHALGTDMIRDAMQAALYVEGVEYVDMEHPAEDVRCSATEAPYCLSMTVSVEVIT